ncbi:MAG: hypothetical protein QM736_07595 [Vicinamibacterales bacterium]
MIVLSQSGLVGPGPDAAIFMADPRWQTLRAVRARRVYTKPRGMSVYFSNLVETPLYAQWLAELGHPQALAPELRTLMQAAYADVGGPLTAAQLDDSLRIAQNRTSCGYTRFAQAISGDFAAPDCLAETRSEP